MTLVAEGVEDEATAGHLAESGCDESQGFYFSRPVTAPALEDWLDARGQAPVLQGAESAGRTASIGPEGMR